MPDDVHCFLTHRDGASALSENLGAWGRALHAVHVPAEPLVFQWTSGGFNEAMASLMVKLGTSAAFAERGDIETDAIWHAWQAVWKVRRELAASLFEVLAYESPGSDLHGLWCEIHEHYLGFPRHPERLWAAEERFVTHPLTGPSFLTGRLVAAQLVEVHSAIADIRSTIWGPGAREATEALVERITGRIPDPDAWVRTLSPKVSG